MNDEPRSEEEGNYGTDYGGSLVEMKLSQMPLLAAMPSNSYFKGRYLYSAQGF